MNAVGVHRGVKALDVTPSNLLVGVGLIVGAKAYAHNIVRSKYVRDGRLRFALGMLLATSVMLMRSSDGLPTPQSRVTLTYNLL